MKPMISMDFDVSRTDLAAAGGYKTIQVVKGKESMVSQSPEQIGSGSLTPT